MKTLTAGSSPAATVQGAKFTAGPWRVGRELGVSQSMPRTEILRDVSYVEGVAPTTYYLAEVCYPTSMPGTVGALERMANARLIAAAPELLEALQLALPRMVHKAECCTVRPTSEWPEHGSTSFENCCCVIKTARAAIRKALEA